MTTASPSPLGRALLALLFLVAAVSVVHAKPSPDEQRAEIRKTRDKVLAELHKLDPGTKDKIRKSVGYAVFSNVGINLFVASTGHGHGVVTMKGTFSDSEVFMRMVSLGLGIGLGVKDFRAVFIFYDKAKLEEFVEKGWDFGGQVDAAAKSDDKGAAVAGAGNVTEGVEVIQITKNGLALQATLQGTKYWKDKDLN